MVLSKIKNTINKNEASYFFIINNETIIAHGNISALMIPKLIDGKNNIKKRNKTNMFLNDTPFSFFRKRKIFFNE